MPPVEQTSVPRQPDMGRRKSITELKTVKKAKEIPVVSDTLVELDKMRHNVSEYARVKSARQMVEDGMKILTENHVVQDGIKVLNNEALQQTMTTMKDKVLPHVVNAVEHMDEMASGGIDSLTTAVPALTTSTPELVQTTKDTARNYFSLATEYMASFTLARVGLRAADKSLDSAEKTVKFFKPDKSDEGIVCTTYSRIRETRRMLRALRRAGERRSYIEMDKLSRAGVMGRVASFLSINMFLHVFGLELVAFKPSKSLAAVTYEAEESQTELKEVEGDFGGYRSEDDPDYHPSSGEDSLDHSTTSESEDEQSCDEHDQGGSTAQGETGGEAPQ